MRDLRAGFFGREAELDALEAALDRAVRFQTPQAVTIVGGAGVGKTRLVDEWLARNAGAGLRVVRAAATREAAPQALLRALLRARFRLDGGIEADEAISWFRSELQGVFGDRRVAEVASLLGGFLGFEMPESPLSRALAAKPEQGAELARAVLCRFLEQDALAQPLVIVADDLHAADDASLDILQSLPA
jgi:predicted ATPase